MYHEHHNHCMIAIMYNYLLTGPKSSGGHKEARMTENRYLWLPSALECLERTV